MMGRLIDADALKAAMKAVKSGLDFPLSTYLKRIIAMILDGAPTVEAIPVEWLLVKREHCKSTWDINFYEAVQIILGEWQKEQEAR